MSMNKPYEGPGELPVAISVFPLESALMLPRCQLPLNIFEPRYMAMIDDSLRGERLIGMVQPASGRAPGPWGPPLQPVGCLGRLTQVAETGDGRYVITLTGVARFRILDELAATTPYRQCRVDYAEFIGDFTPRSGEEAVDRESLLRALRAFADSSRLKIDWNAIDQARNEELVNALAMMSPFGPEEKQALLEAPDLKTRAEALVAITEFELARARNPASRLQ
jgi:Lon protease-like protein